MHKRMNKAIDKIHSFLSSEFAKIFEILLVG